MILCMCRKGFASSNQLVRLTSSGSQGGISTLGPCEPRGRQVSWVLWVAEEAPVSPASWGLSSGCTGAPLLAQLLSSPRLLIPFRMAPPSNKAPWLGVLTRVPPTPASEQLLLSSPQCSSWCLTGVVEEGWSLPPWVSPSMAEGPRSSGAHKLTPSIGWRLGEAPGCFRGSYREPRVPLAKGKCKQSWRATQR